MDLEKISPLNLAKVCPAATLIDAEDRFEGIQRTSMNVEIVGKDLANSGTAARLINRFRIPCFEQQIVRFSTCLGVATEERAHISLK